MVQQTGSTPWSWASCTGTQSVLLYGCFLDRMGSQLAGASALKTVVSSRAASTYQPAGVGSRPIRHSSVGTSMAQSDSQSVLRQQHSSGVHLQTRRNSFHVPIPQDSGIVSSAGSVSDNSNPNTSSGSPQCDNERTIMSQQSQSHRMASSSRDLTQSVLCRPDSSHGHVRHSGEQGDPDLRFTLPGPQGLGGRRPLHILRWIRADLCLPSSSHSSLNSGKDQILPRHDSDHHSLTTPISTVASTSTATQPTYSHSITRRGAISVHS